MIGFCRLIHGSRVSRRDIGPIIIARFLALTGRCNAVLEGMAAGLAILGSDVSGSVKDRVSHGFNGFVHPAGNAEVLAEHIEFALTNPAKIAEMGRRARLTAEEWPVDRGVEIVCRILHDTCG